MPDGIFEATFAELAHALLAERAPALMNRLVGFQILDQDEDETRAVGVFGFKLDEQNWLYAPAFFLSGRVKGLDMLYVRNQDLFIPLQDDWVSFLLSKGLAELGAPEEMSLAELRTRMPNFSLISQSPSKSASVTSEDEKEFNTSCKMLKKAFSTMPDGFDRDTITGSLPFVMDLRNLVDKAPVAGMELAKVASDNVAVKAALLHFYGGMKDLLPDPKKVEDQLTKVAAAASKRVSLKDMVTKFAGAPDNPGAVSVIGPKELPWYKIAMTEEEITQVMLGNVVVHDTRKVANLVVNEDETRTRTTPTDNDEYNLILADGSQRECYVSREVRHIAYGEIKNLSMVVPLDNPNPFEAGLYARSHLVVQTKPKETQPRTKIKSKTVTPASAQQGKSYAILFSDGALSPIFQVVSKELTDGNVILRTYIDDGVRVYDSGCGASAYRGPSSEMNRYLSSPRRLYKANPSSLRPTIEGESSKTLTIDGAKYTWDTWSDGTWQLTFRDNHSGDKPCINHTGCTLSKDLQLVDLGYMKSDDEPDLLKLPVSRDVLFDPIFTDDKSTFTISVDKVANSRYDVVVAGKLQRDLNEVQALTTLLKEAGLREDDARFMLERQGLHKKEQYRIQKSAYKIDESSLSAPWPDDNNNIFSDAIGISAQESFEKTEPLPGLVNPSNRDAYNIWRDSEVKQVLEAAQSGKKEVFDTSMVKSLAKSIDISALIDEYIPDLMRGMDRVARVLFLFYWHLDKFQDRYGRQDVVELEDALKNTFKSQGDLILFLKRRTVDASPELQSMEMGLGGIA